MSLYEATMLLSHLKYI